MGDNEQERVGDDGGVPVVDALIGARRVMRPVEDAPYLLLARVLVFLLDMERVLSGYADEASELYKSAVRDRALGEAGEPGRRGRCTKQRYRNVVRNEIGATRRRVCVH